jgi:hypothetical protein
MLETLSAKPGAERTRWFRERRKHGGVLVQFEVVGTALDDLSSLGWFREDRRDKSASPTL